MSTAPTRAGYRRLLAVRRERLASIDKNAPGISIRHVFVKAVRRAQVGVFWPWLGRIVGRLEWWKQGRAKIKCERCGSLKRSRDLEIVNKTELVCRSCAQACRRAQLIKVTVELVADGAPLEKLAGLQRILDDMEPEARVAVTKRE